MRFSEKDIQLLLQGDAGRMSTDMSGYIKANNFMYRLACETWYLIVAEKDEAAAELLYDLIVRDGLIPTIAAAQEQATALIKGYGMSSAWKFITKTCSTQEALQVLRYLKRFSPFKADIVETNSIRSFKQVNNDVKMSQRFGYPQYLIKSLRFIVYYIVGAKPGYIEDTNQWIGNFSSIDWWSARDEGYFSSGAIAGVTGDKSLATKLHNWKLPYYIDMMYPISDHVMPNWCEYPFADDRRPYCGVKHPYDSYMFNMKIAEIQAVPKNFKTARIIAKEEVTRQWHLQAVNWALRDRLASDDDFSQIIPLDNQEVNRENCYLASLTNSLATIDSSAASDHIAVSLFREVFPEDIVLNVMRYRGSHIRYSTGKVDLAHMIATSGSGVCFVLESILFEAIALLATTDSKFYKACECDSDLVMADWYDILMEVIASHVVMSYGDDVILPSDAAPLFIEYMERLGFVINVEKSFYNDEYYREACGVEFYKGTELTTTYFPRKSLRKDVGALESLLSLNLKLFSFTKIHSYLKSICKDIVPASKWTTSSFDEYIEHECTDFVDYVGTEKSAVLPIGPAERVVRKGTVTYKGQYQAVDFPTYEHFVVSSRAKKLSPYEVPEIYYYVEFLKNGPRYDDPLSELLRVSSPVRGVHDRSTDIVPVIRTLRE